jgi:GTPase SAR1 family protein
MNAKQQTWVEHAGRLIDLFDAGKDPDRSAWAALIQQRLALPQAYVTVVGETSTGKSSLVNALLTKPVLPVSAKPTTGIVTHLACRSEPEPRLLAIYRDATQELINANRFEQLSLEPEEDLLRLQARVMPKSATHVGLHVFDTPGYNAVLSRHEEVLMTFLPQSDVIVFVVGHRTGFGQTDQDLFEAVAAATAHDQDIPLLLVINRAPQGCTATDKRVAEIRRLAEDGLRRPMSLQIVPSTKVQKPDGTIAHLPMAADSLWDEVHRHAMNPARLATVQRKLEQQLLQLIDDADAAAERDEVACTANADQRKLIEEQLALTRDARDESLREIDSTMTRLATALPLHVDKLISASLPRIDAEIMTSNKWLGSADCAEWIAGHCLPFEVRSIGQAIEEHIAIEMEALNRRLEEIANTTIAELDKTVALPSDDPARRFAVNVASTLGQRLAGKAINSALRGLGGVGGAAAGAGNLAKMAVSRVGRLFGKTFGREVYNQIGRVFTKKMLERLNVAVQVVIEVVSFIRDASTWQNQLIQSSHAALAEWHEETSRELLNQHIPQICEANRAMVAEVYADICEPDRMARETDQSDRLESVRAYRQKLAQLRRNLQTIITPHCA